MLIYIIGAITGNQEYREQFARAEDALHREYPCDVINPAKRGNLSQADYARLSYNAVAKADAVACLWTTLESFGAAMERLIALDAGKRVMFITPEYKIMEVDSEVPVRMQRD
jgi:hypothetical protein